METLQYIVRKLKLHLNKKSPIHIEASRYSGFPELFKELGFKTGVEVGVSEGAYSEVLCQVVPDLKLFSVDPWTYYPVHNRFRRQHHHDRAYKVAVERLSKYPNCTIVKKTSEEAAKDFEDESIDFVFIDGDHSFIGITRDLQAWIPKVKVGGIVSGHDFSDSPRGWFGAVETVVRAWMKFYQITPWFVIDDTESRYAEREISWFFVKTHSWLNKHKKF